MNSPYQLRHFLPLLCLIAALCVGALLSGCVSAPVQPPWSDLFAQYVTPDVAMPAPAALPDRPTAKLVSTPAGDLLAFDASQAQRLVTRDEIGEANTLIAQECSAGFAEVTDSYGTLLSQAQQHERMYNLLGAKWADAETQLQRQDKAHEVENWINRALMLIAVGIAL